MKNWGLDTLMPNTTPPLATHVAVTVIYKGVGCEVADAVIPETDGVAVIAELADTDGVKLDAELPDADALPETVELSDAEGLEVSAGVPVLAGDAATHELPVSSNPAGQTQHQ